MNSAGGLPARRMAGRVVSFDEPFSSLHEERFSPRRCVVRVTHASVGITDVMARRGDYLLHPLRGFVPGYDFVGVLERVDAAGRRLGLASGQRVTGVLPSMGGHATWLDVPASLLVPVPDGLPSEVVATLPLDAVTAAGVMGALPPGAKTLCIQGMTGAIGFLTMQLAVRQGMTVAGTGSPEKAAHLAPFGVRVFNYRDPAWREQLLQSVGEVDAVVDHTGDRTLKNLVSRRGCVVRIAFGGREGRQKRATVVGFANTMVRFAARPAERLVSVPLSINVNRSAYRRRLEHVLQLVAEGELQSVSPELYPAASYADSLRAASAGVSGAKVVIEFADAR